MEQLPHRSVGSVIESGRPGLAAHCVACSQTVWSAVEAVVVAAAQTIHERHAPLRLSIPVPARHPLSLRMAGRFLFGSTCSCGMASNRTRFAICVKRFPGDVTAMLSDVCEALSYLEA